MNEESFDENWLRKDIERIRTVAFEDDEYEEKEKEEEYIHDRLQQLISLNDLPKFKKRLVDHEQHPFVETSPFNPSTQTNERIYVETPKKRRSQFFAGNQTHIDEQLDKDSISKIETYVNTPSLKSTNANPSSFSALDSIKHSFQDEMNPVDSDLLKFENSILKQTNASYSNIISALRKQNEELQSKIDILNEILKIDTVVTDQFIEEHFESFFETEIQSGKTVQKCKFCFYMGKDKKHPNNGRFEKSPPIARRNHLKKHLTRDGIAQFFQIFFSHEPM